PPATTGELKAWPTASRQSTLGGSFQAATCSVVLPSRFGPSHCGQSAARATTAQASSTTTVLNHVMGHPPRWTAGAGDSGEVDVGLAVLGVLLAEPAEELPVVFLAAVAPVGVGVVTQVEQAAPAPGGVGRRAVRREAAEDGHVARLQLQGHGGAVRDGLRGGRGGVARP